MSGRSGKERSKSIISCGSCGIFRVGRKTRWQIYQTENELISSLVKSHGILIT